MIEIGPIFAYAMMFKFFGPVDRRFPLSSHSN